MTLAQLQTALQAKGYGTDTAAVQIELLNSVYRRLTGKKRFRWQEAQGTIATVVGTTSYATTTLTTFLHPDAVRIEIGSEFPDMKYIDYEELRDLQHRDRDAGTPSMWTYGRGLIHVWPKPDRIYTMTVDYTLDPADLSAAGDIPILPVTYHDVLVWGAIKEIAFRQRDWAAVQWATKEYEDRVHEMEAECGIRQRQSSGHVKDSGFYDGFRKTW